MSLRAITLFASCLCLLPMGTRAASDESSRPVISIGGLVQNPLHLSLSDLQRFQRVSVSVSVSSDEGMPGRGTRYHGVPLRTLLELVKLQTPSREGEEHGTDSIADADIAVSIKNRSGQQLVLSWGEIFLQSDAEIVVADRSEPGGDLPALFFSERDHSRRLLDSMVSIEVVQVPPLGPEPVTASRSAPMITFDDCKKNILLSEALSGSSPVTSQGIPLHSLLRPGGVAPDSTMVIRVRSASGASAVVSLNELDTPVGQRVLIVPRKLSDGPDDIAYDLVVPGDSSRARWMADIERVEVVDMKQKPFIYVVGIGCGDASLLTNEAISCMARADVFICKEDDQSELAGYLAGKPVLFDPFMQLGRFYRTKHPEVTEKEAEEAAAANYQHNMQAIRDALDEGKIVALLEPGDPTLYGGWRNWLLPHFPPDRIKVVAGMSSFNVANAVLGEYDVTRTSIIITEPQQAHASIVQAAAQSGGTIVVFMGLTRMKDLVPRFNEYFPPDTPVHLLYDVGIAGKERRVKSTLANVVADIESNKESFLGLIYIGSNLK